MAKNLLQLQWIENSLPESVLKKHMFGGYAYYLHEKLVLVMFEKGGGKSFDGKRYPFELWNGCMFPVEKEVQHKVLEVFPFLVPHPILPKWLYLPLNTEDFDEKIESLLRKVFSPVSLFGVVPKVKRKSSAETKIMDSNIDTRRPRMFGDLKKALKTKSSQRSADKNKKRKAAK
ncbi:MAG: hypothetical protein ACXVCP_19140 [Bdellovibrio sp.]